ncbi:hypothetical protein Cgig2_013074 [Carnegiea gigantea]|uniref:Carotenoid cleavage dioxygenase 7 n=1 Tax=Carnegiea gigantea TaxID=171969 RepID=A0A9Q1QM26_9CARY|nr:hypothetical protein Cgig2_013074 [Carnegiea gigantea]
MHASLYHMITPAVFRPSEKLLPSRDLHFRRDVSLTQFVSILTSGNEVSMPEMDDKTAAFWDYQSLFTSQRLEVENPIKLRLIDGALPRDFPSGTYYLTGPGLFADDYGSMVHPLDGHGYLRAFEIDGPKGEVKFSAKYVKTEAQMEECDLVSGSWRFTHRGPFSVLKGGKKFANTKVMKNVANTNILKWGVFKMPPKRLLSHYKVDVRRGRLIIMACNAEDMLLPRSHFTFYEFDVNLNLLQKREFNIPDHLMIHDWAFTDTYYIIFGNRVRFDISGSMAAISGVAPMISALSVNHSRPTSPIYLLPRFSSTDSTSHHWQNPIEAPQLWLLHVANAFEEVEGDGSLKIQIHATACAYKWFNFLTMFGYNWQSRILDPSIMNGTGKEQLLPNLVKLSIESEKSENHHNFRYSCTATSLREGSRSRCSDFPIINPKCSGHEHRYIYAAAASGTHETLPNFPFDTVLKLDCLNGKVRIWCPGNRTFIGEPMFVSRGPSMVEEDDGYLVLVEYVVSNRRCNLVILDARRIGEASAVVARFEVPKHLTFPLGFHGAWASKE